MSDQNDQIKQFFDFQVQNLKPVADFYANGVDIFEKFTRQGYAVAGDFVDFAVQQAKLPTEVQNVNDYANKQVETTRAFGAKMVERFLGFADLARSAQAQTTEVVAAEVKKAA